MTPKNFLIKFMFENHRPKFEKTGEIRQLDISSDSFWETVEVMNEYAKLMCQKQREICAEEAKTVRCPDYDKVNKDSILNASFPEELQDED